MLLFGIASVMLAFAAILFGMASLFKAIGMKIPEKERELTAEEKEALNSQIAANKAYQQGIQNLFNGQKGDIGDFI